MKTERYTHHGSEVEVVSELRGRHREVCLCYSCKHFLPGTTANCEIARAVYDNCVKFNLVTPMVECPRFERGS